MSDFEKTNKFDDDVCIIVLPRVFIVSHPMPSQLPVRRNTGVRDFAVKPCIRSDTFSESFALASVHRYIFEFLFDISIPVKIMPTK